MHVFHDLEHAFAPRAHFIGKAEQFRLPRFQRGDRLTVARPVEQRARSTDADGAMLQRFAIERAHPRDILRRGRFAVRPALAHDIDTQRGMGDIAGHIHVEAAAGKEIEIFGIGFPCPRQAGGQHRERDILHPFHQADERVPLIRAAGANPTPQLPMIAVVMPWKDEGFSRCSHVTWPS